tara:strand:- start:741 stop:920 length:180 start_codon:yes stop_codon:yes gene_type:complete
MKEVSLFTLWDAIKDLFGSIYQWLLDDAKRMEQLQKEHIAREKALESFPDDDSEDYLGI